MSNKEDIAFRKLSMLMKAVTEANERETLKNAAQPTFFSRVEQLPTDGKKIDCGSSDEATEVFCGCYSLDELKAAAFEVLLLNPGSAGNFCRGGRARASVLEINRGRCSVTNFLL